MLLLKLGKMAIITEMEAQKVIKGEMAMLSFISGKTLFFSHRSLLSIALKTDLPLFIMSQKNPEVC